MFIVLVCTGTILALVYSSQAQASNEGMVNALVDDYHYTQIASEPLAQIRAEIKTPEDAIKFRDANFNYVTDSQQFNQVNYVTSLQTFYSNGWNGDCEDYAIAIAGLLEDDGYAPLTLSLERKATEEEKIMNNLGKTDYPDVIGHRIFVYRENGKWGSIGVSSDDDRLPVFDSLEDLAADLNTPNQEKYSLASFEPLKNLNSEFSEKSWIEAAGNLSD